MCHCVEVCDGGSTSQVEFKRLQQVFMRSMFCERFLSAEVNMTEEQQTVYFL